MQWCPGKETVDAQQAKSKYTHRERLQQAKRYPFIGDFNEGEQPEEGHSVPGPEPGCTKGTVEQPGQRLPAKEFWQVIDAMWGVAGSPPEHSIEDEKNCYT